MVLRQNTWITLFVLIFIIIVVVGWRRICVSELDPATVAVTWSYDYRASPPCKTSHATVCVDHFEVYDITSRPRLLQVADNPPQAFGDVNISSKFLLGPPFGTRTISVVAVGRDNSGAPASSSNEAAKIDVMISPHKPRFCFDWMNPQPKGRSSEEIFVQWKNEVRGWLKKARDSVHRHLRSR